MRGIGHRGTARRARALSALVVATGTVGLLGPPDAAASVARVHPGECTRYGCATNTIVYEAAPGERNRLQITKTPGGFTLRDPGAATQAGSGCTAQTGGAFCRDYDSTPFLYVRLGDGDDRLDASTVEWVTAAGDEGDDVLVGGPRSSSLVGGSGSDKLHGGPGVNGLAGDGVLLPVDSEKLTAPPDALPSRDILDGSKGQDSASYAGRTAPVTVDLATGLGGVAGEQDQLLSIEGASGGAGRDSLRGDAHNNGLNGLGGNDVLNGAGGSDRLLGGKGNDLMRGGAGDDVLEASGRYGADGGGSPGKDRLLCGTGSDQVESPEMVTYVSPECERVTLVLGLNFGTFQLRFPLKSLRSPSVAIEEVFCVDVRCRTRMTLRLARRIGKQRAGAIVGRQSIRLRGNGKRRCYRGVRLTATGRRLLRARRRLLVQFTTRQDSGDGRRGPNGFRTRLVLGGGRSPESPPASPVGNCFR